jgi:hypothetical protein
MVIPLIHSAYHVRLLYEDARLKKRDNWARRGRKWRREYQIDLENILADWEDYREDERHTSVWWRILDLRRVIGIQHCLVNGKSKNSGMGLVCRYR